MSRRLVALVSLLFTYLFFLEYLSPFRKVHIPFDLEGFHYPLADYAFQSLKQGRFPLWDPSMYSGMSFVSNIQTALFYPPTWLVFAGNASRDHLTYQGLQMLEVAHVWLAFVLCFLWLRDQDVHDLAAILGAGVYAFSGYMCVQLQHEGLIVAYAWFPLGLWGIDQCAATGRWRPLWKLVAASACAMLGGYPPTWFVYIVAVGAYALFKGWRVLLGAIAAVAISLALVAVQLLPSAEASRYMVMDVRYGAGIRDLGFYLSYLIPNFYDFGKNTPVLTNLGQAYLYLGAPAMLGLAFLALRRDFRKLIPVLGMLVAILIFLTNPFDIVWISIRNSAFLSALCRDWYFLAGITLALTPMCAYGLDAFLRRPSKPVSKPLVVLISAGLLAWSVFQFLRWRKGSLSVGWPSAIDAGVILVLSAVGLIAVRGSKGSLRTLAATALLLGIGMDYKVFGTSMRQNGAAGPGTVYLASSLPAMDTPAYLMLRDIPGYRIALDRDSLYPDMLRQIHFNSPQGFDPMLTVQYKNMLGDAVKFRTDREFDIDPEQYPLLQRLGVRYFITGGESPVYQKLAHNAHYRPADSGRSYYHVFEYLDARPAYGWESPAPDCRADRVRWTPEVREFSVYSAAGGRFTLSEQLMPGWTAQLDGREVPVERWQGAFQAVSVPGGDHTVQFRYHPSSLTLGAWISALTLVMLAATAFFTK